MTSDKKFVNHMRWCDKKYSLRAFADGPRLVPSREFWMPQDGGGAETGLGGDVGAGEPGIRLVV